MEKTKTINNLKNIFIQSYIWRNTDLSEKETKKKITIVSKLNIILAIISIIISVISKNLNETTLNSILTFTSIFSTLIIPVLIMIYDKFMSNPNQHLTEIQQKSKGAKNRLKIYKNFTKRFIFTSLENVFIAITIISLIIIYKSFLSTFFNIQVFDYSRQSSVNFEGVKIALHLFSVIIFKTFFIFLLIKFIWFIFYSIGALGDFFKSGLNDD